MKHEIVYKCPNCNETGNLHINYDYSKKNPTIEEILCNECGEFFEPKREEGYYWIRLYKTANLEIARWFNNNWLLIYKTKAYKDNEIKIEDTNKTE